MIPVQDMAFRLAPQCLLSTGTRVINIGSSSRADQAHLSYSLEDRDYLIRTVAFEAPNEPDLGKAAVAYVVLNRQRSGRWGHDVREVVTQPWQFEPWMTRRKEIEKLSPDDPRYRKAALIADAVLAGDVPDPTIGATFFLNPMVVRQRRGGSLPLWARGEGLAIGRHTFYWPAGDTARPSFTAIASAWFQAAIRC
jgi:N-acetylmuramoyl-L-alanine amidase